MKFENKKWVLRVALAGALSLGVATVAKADDSASAAPVFSGFAQELATQIFGTATKTSTTSNAVAGDSLGFTLQHVVLGASVAIDSIDTLKVSTDLLNLNTGGNPLLLDANDTHSLGDIYSGLALKVGQFRLPFGADAYTDANKLIRINYSEIDGLIPGGQVADGGDNYDLGLELDQNWSDLSVQVAVVQNPNNTNSTGGSALAGTDNKDWVARAQWTTSKNLTLGLSDYYSASTIGVVNNVNTLGANATVNIDVVQLDLEAIFGDAGNNGYTGTLSAKLNGFQPAVWYEFANKGTVPLGTNAMQFPDLGVGVNFWLAAKTRLAINADFTGENVATTPAADLLAVNTETVQLTESF
jgi:hypothetical protein